MYRQGGDWATPRGFILYVCIEPILYYYTDIYSSLHAIFRIVSAFKRDCVLI